MSTYTNQTVSSSVSVLGCNTLAVQNVTVASNGNLSLSAPAQITINGPFEVKSGGILNIRQSQQMIFTYTYDASGNRTTRQFSAMASSLEAVPVRPRGGLIKYNLSILIDEINIFIYDRDIYHVYVPIFLFMCPRSC